MSIRRGAFALFLSSCVSSGLLAGCGGGGSSNSTGNGTTNNNPVPSITSISPNGAAESGPAFTLTVAGSGFISSSQLQWKGTALTTTYQSATSLQAQVPASDLSPMGSVDVTVVNPAPGGGTSNAVSFTVGNPVPVLTSISPASAPSGSGALTVTATGSNFVSNSVIQWNGTALTTTFVSGTQLTAQLPAADLAALATGNITVVNPSPSGGTSSAVAFTVGNPVPVLASISPTSAPSGSGALTVTATGSNFVSNSVIQWNGTALTTTYVSATQLTTQIPAADLAAIGAGNITVVNPSPNGGTSGAVAFTIGNPVPVLTSISPSSEPAGLAAVTLTVTGSSFISGSVIQWNGTALTTGYVSATQLTAQVPSADLSAVGTANVTVVNPTPDGGSSTAAQFSILAPTTKVTTINLPVNALVWDPTHSLLYASLPSTDTNGNTIVSINPVTATVGTPQPAGSEPHPLALSSDNSFLYVGDDGNGQVLRFNTPGLTLDTSLTLQLPVNPTFGQQVALALAVAPGQPHTIAAILGNYAWTPYNTGGTFLYDDATPRANEVTSNNADDTAVAWGASSSVLYANDGQTSGNDLFVLSASASGLALTTDYGYLAPTQFGRIAFDPASGFIYVDGGRVVDPATGNVLATFNLAPLVSYIAPRCALDLQNGVVFFLGQTLAQYNAGSGATIEAFDAKTYKLLATLPVPEATGYPFDFVRWGNAGLAFRTSSSNSGGQPTAGPIYIVDGAFVNSQVPPDSTTGATLTVNPTLTSISPQSAVAGSGNTTLIVTGTNFDSGSVVMWNGTALLTTVTSGTQLQATIPQADLTAAGSAIVSVASTVSNLSTATSLGFTILPAQSGTTNLAAWNFASLDVVWDASNSKLILPLWSADPSYPNSILEIDPSSGTVANSVSVSADPDLVRVTSDGSELYVGFRVVNAVQELTLPDLATNLSWSLGYDPSYGPFYAWDVEPAPGAPQTAAVTFASNGFDPPQTNGMTIYDSGVARANGTYRQVGFQNAQWSATPATIYAIDNAITFYTYGVNASGLTLESQQELLITGAGVGFGRIHFDPGTGYLYADGGQVIDPATNTIIGNIGNFNAPGLVVPDSSLNRVFILGQLPNQTGNNSYTIQSFDQTTFALVNSLTLTSLVGQPRAFIRWGTNGLALVTYNQNASATNGPAGMLYVISDSTFVSANSVQGLATTQTQRVHDFPRPVLATDVLEKR